MCLENFEKIRENLLISDIFEKALENLEKSKVLQFYDISKKIFFEILENFRNFRKSEPNSILLE